MIQVWCARCGARGTIPQDSSASWSRCQACGYSQKIPGSQSLEPAKAEPDTYPLAEPLAARPAGSSIPRDVPSKKAKARTRLQDRWADLLRGTSKEPSRLEGLSLALIAVSVADLLMTFVLLRTHSHFYESNPIAHWFFARWNMVGMVAFKFSLIGLAIVIGEYVERRRPRWGQAVLFIGCLAAVYAFLTGLRLYLGHGGEPMIELD